MYLLDSAVLVNNVVPHPTARTIGRNDAGQIRRTAAGKLSLHYPHLQVISNGDQAGTRRGDPGEGQGYRLWIMMRV